MAKLLKIRLKRSLIGKHKKLKKTVLALGLRKVGQETLKRDTPQIRGMIRQVQELIEVTEVEEPTEEAHDV